jgi:hypothetical protein
MSYKRFDLQLKYAAAYAQRQRYCLLQAARTRDDLPDLINMAIEELIRQRFELPAFSTFVEDRSNESLRDLRDNWAPVTGLVVFAVGFTTAAVAVVAHTLIPTMS